MAVDTRTYFTHTFVCAFSVMTSSSPFLPPSLGNTYRLFPLLVFRVKKKLTTATNRNFCDSKSCADKQNNANHFSSASARVESCFRMSRTIQTLSREPRSFIFVLSLRQRYTYSISSSTRNVGVSLRPVTRIRANLRALSLLLAARTPPLARASPFARTTDTRIDSDTTRRCLSRFATTIQSSRILSPRCRRPPPCCRRDRLSPSNRRR